MILYQYIFIIRGLNLTTMEILEKKEMPETIHRIKGAELPQNLQKRFKVEPNQLLTLTINIETEEYDTENVGSEIIEGLKEIIAHKKGEITFPPAL